jgi:hypothetical protein
MKVNNGFQRRAIRIMTMVCIGVVCGVGPFFLLMNVFQQQNALATPGSVMQDQQMNAVAPFMHRPYYGSRTVLQRTISYFDHDDPWYDDDGTFVRYDGATWRNYTATIYDCTASVSCYDGHNGYDLNLWFEPVLSVASGRVIRANWYDAFDHSSSFGLWVAIDHGNGFISAYGHLSSIQVAVGDTVGSQWQIGTSGTTGASTGPHLHLSVYYSTNWQATDPFGWSGGSRDPNVVADKYLWVNSPATASTIPNLSANGNAVYPGAILVDDSMASWHGTGAWHKSAYASDIRGSLRWAWTVSGSATAAATWRPTIPKSGYYEVGVYIPEVDATSGWIPYTVTSANPSSHSAVVRHTVYVDGLHIGTFTNSYGTVTTGPQWVGLGTYYFNAGTSSTVVINNATGESGLQVAADATEFIPV